MAGKETDPARVVGVGDRIKVEFPNGRKLSGEVRGISGTAVHPESARFLDGNLDEFGVMAEAPPPSMIPRGDILSIRKNVADSARTAALAGLAAR